MICRARIILIKGLIKQKPHQDLQTDSLPLGQYILILSVDGQIKDQKIIIKK